MRFSDFLHCFLKNMTWRNPLRECTLGALIKFAISSLSSLPFAHFRTFLLSFCSFSPSGTWKSFDLGDFPRAISRPGPRAGIRTSRTNFSKFATATTSGWGNVGTGRRKNLFRAHRQLAHANHSRPDGEVPTPESEPTPLQRDFLW